MNVGPHPFNSRVFLVVIHSVRNNLLGLKLMVTNKLIMLLGFHTEVGEGGRGCPGISPQGPVPT